MITLKDHRRALWRLRRDVRLVVREGRDGLAKVIDRKRLESLRGLVYRREGGQEIVLRYWHAYKTYWRRWG